MTELTRPVQSPQALDDAWKRRDFGPKDRRRQIHAGFDDLGGNNDLTRIRRDRWGIRNGKGYEEVVHGITRRPAEKADARRLWELVREHWRIENGLHYVRDVTLGEDACQVRRGSAPQVLAALRNVGVHLLAHVEADNHARPIRRLTAQFHEAINLLTSPL